MPINKHTITADERYECFVPLYQMCLDQIQKGKGLERHGEECCFKNQATYKIIEAYGEGFPLGQAVKKLLELMRFEGTGRKKHELIGAINYAIFALLYLEGKK